MNDSAPSKSERHEDTGSTRRSSIARRSLLKSTAALGLATFAGVGSAESPTERSTHVDHSMAEDPVDYVDPFIGTARAAAAGSGSGAMPYPNTYPGATRPHGMVQLSPDTSQSNIAGYHYDDDELLGFSHTHVSGTGCYGLGNFLATPTTADIGTIKESHLNPQDAFSASFWFRTSGDMPGGITSVLRHDRHATPLQLWDGGGQGHFVWFPAGGDGYRTLAFDFSTYADDSWHHYAVTYDADSRAAVYVDGDEVASTTENVGSLATSSLPWSIGGAVDNGGEYYDGDLDEVSVYGRALDADEVQSLATGGTVSDDEAIFAFSFDDSGVDRVEDLAGGDDPGIVHGDPTWVSGKSGKALAFDGAGDAVGVELPTLGSSFSHDGETAKPGYYAVTLDDYDVDAEVTATDRVGMHRYAFSGDDAPTIALDAAYNLSDSGTKDASVEIRDDRTVVGSQTVPDPFCSGAEAFSIHFVAKFSEPFASSGTWSGSTLSDCELSAEGTDVGAYVDYPSDVDEVVLKVGISYVSVDNALDNLDTEVPDWDFDAVRDDASDAWAERLGRVEVEGDDDNMVKFYTALYHAMLGPTKFNDANGEYLGMDDEVYVADGYDHYQMYSLWDTFRAEHPLLNIVEPEVQTDAMQSLVDMYEHGGWLPKWEFANRYTNVMIADHATSVISESIVKGLDGFDVETAYEAMYKNSTQVPGDDTYFAGRGGLEAYDKYGYVPADVADQSVSRTLEDSYCDYAIAQAADVLGKSGDRDRFMERATYYENVFDPDTKWMRPRMKDGSWKTPFEPTDWDAFTEGNSWSYSFHVLQDVAGLVDLMGKDRFVDRLDHFFGEFVYPNWGDAFSHYWQGNEPDQHYPYLYNYVGQAWKTQRTVQNVMNELYTTGPGGIPGNEDVGQMSAWFAMSAMGFYPVSPASGTYVVGAPAFEKVTIHLPDYHYDGGDFVIETTGADYSADRHRYIQNAHLDGDVHRESWFRHEDLADGGTLRLDMGDEKNEDWGVNPKPHVDLPPSMSD